MNPSDTTTLNDRQLMTCRWALAYRHRGTLPDPEYRPNENSTRQAADRALQTVIADHLGSQNWQLEPPDAGMVPHLGDYHVTGQPDAVGRHPTITEGRPTPVIMRVATAGSVNRLIRMTLPLAQPGVAARAALHHRMMTQPDDPDAPPAVIATMNADSRQIGIDYLFAETLSSLYDHALRWAEPLLTANGALPEPDYQPDSQTCRTCPFRIRCHGPVPDETPTPDDSDQALADACQRYAEAKQEADRYADAEKQRKAASDDIKRILDNLGLTEYRHHGDQPLTIRLSAATTYSYDRKAMTRMLTPDQLAEVISERRSQRISITLPKNG